MDLAMSLGQPINGVKGPSALMNLQHYDLVWGQSVDYMHCVLLGVTKQVMDTLLDSSNSHQQFYIGKHIENICACCETTMH